VALLAGAGRSDSVTAIAEPIRLTVPLVLDAMRAVVAEQGPDFVYQPPPEDGLCVNAVNGAPSCLIGHVLHRLGVPVALLERWPTAPVWELLAHLKAELIVTADSDVADVLGTAQDVQDAGDGTWGEALTAAEQTARELGLSEATP
jgi:hypothetical protein